MELETSWTYMRNRRIFSHIFPYNLLNFCENLLENLLKSPKKSKSKSAMTPVLLIWRDSRCVCHIDCGIYI